MRQPKSNSLRLLIKILRQKINESKTKEGSEQQNLPGEEKIFNRRKFLVESSKGVLAITIASSLPLLHSCDGADKSSEKKSTTKSAEKNIQIAIIGGGIAGLNCAYHLQKAGIKATIYEASQRMGGRILTHYNDSTGLGIFPEFGGDFIDSSHEDMLGLAKEFNLETIDLKKEMIDQKLQNEVYYFNNKNIPEKEIIKEFHKISGKIGADIASLGDDYNTEAAILLDNTPLSKYIDSLPCAKWMKQLFHASFTAEYGLDCSEQSTLNFLDMINPDTKEGFEVFGDSDERYRIKGGNSKIIESITAKLERNQIKRGFRLTTIEDAENNQYQLSFENEKPVISDYVVMAIPFTILRNVKINLKDMLPEKRKCIDELGFGNNTKLVLVYDGSPWRDGPNPSTGRVCQENITNGWDGGYTKTENNSHGAYVCYFGGKYSEDLSKSSFMNPRTPPTHKWRTELPKEKVVQLSKELDRSFKGSHKKFVNKHVYVNWIDYPYTKGSYSCFKTGQWNTLAAYTRAPIGKVLFAGEHCSTDFQGFMNGGAETGRRAAEDLKVLLG